MIYLSIQIYSNNHKLFLRGPKGYIFYDIYSTYYKFTTLITIFDQKISCTLI